MRVLLFFIFCFSIAIAFSQEIIVKDTLLKTPIENVNFNSGNVGMSTNEDGIVDISIFEKSDTITITHLSYEALKISASNIPSIIYLSPDVKMLPSINFSSEKTIPINSQIVGTIAPKEMLINQKSTAAFLEGNLGITVQESHSGGGSPNFRGMEANRLLLIVDGIPLNNAIYRSGHLQSVSTINPFFIEKVSLISAPASVAYGNGAMGGALLFQTKQLNENAVHLHQQYESASSAVLFNFLSNYHFKKIAITSGFSIKSVGELKMGRNRLHGYYSWGKEPFVTNGNKQLYTAFSQADFFHKMIYQIAPLKRIVFNTQYATSSNINRFDKLNDEKGGFQKYADWYYGPQNRFFQSVSLINKTPTFLFDSHKSTVAYQELSESRHHKKTGEYLLSNRFENVKIYDFVFDCNKQIIWGAKILYGLGGRLQKVTSTANFSDYQNMYFNLSRYPDGGSVVSDYFVYGQLKLPLAKKVESLIGVRLNQNNLEAKFNNPIFDIEQLNSKNSSLLSSLLLSYKATDNTTFNASYYKGFRNPNIDDVGKVFSKNDRDVVVPNDELQSEYSNNIELGINYRSKKLSLQFQIFNINIANAISRSYGTLNGVDSIIFDGEMMRIQMNKNISSARINGISFYAKYRLTNQFSVFGNCNYLQAEADGGTPLAHIPPLNANIAFNYSPSNHEFGLGGKYNARKYADDFDLEGVDNLDEATSDGSPMWYTINCFYKQHVDQDLILGIGIENIMDIHYKTFASGISAGGRNLIISLEFKF